MKIKGELFYNMVTHEVVEFSPRDVNMIFVQDCEIQIVSVDDYGVIDTQCLYVVTVVMNDGNIYAAQPFEDSDYAEMIAGTLFRYCEDVAHGN